MARCFYGLCNHNHLVAYIHLRYTPARPKNEAMVNDASFSVARITHERGVGRIFLGQNRPAARVQDPNMFIEIDNVTVLFGPSCESLRNLFQSFEIKQWPIQ